MQKIISVIVPVYNEEGNIPLIRAELADVFASSTYGHEIIFVNDGSTDNSQTVIDNFAHSDTRIKSIEFSRNFGKEEATSAGLHHATGHAVIVIDADLQHPTSLIPEFIDKWEKGAEVVIGLRIKSKSESWAKRLFSFLYYKIITTISDTPIEPGATDFRLLDKKVVDAFNVFTERERMTRGLIDWLGFRREFISFEANERVNGTASYSYVKLIRLALSSFVSHSLTPLKLAGRLGVFIILIFGFGGFLVFVEHYILGDPLGLAISGTAQLAIIMIFFIGVVLSCLGLVALYIANIHNEVSGRPLYVVRDVKNIK